MDYQRIGKELAAGSIRPVYLFCGEEDFLRDEAVAALIARFLPGQSREADLTRVDGACVSLEEVLDMAETVALFGRRLIVVKEAPYFAKSSKPAEESAQRLLSLASQKDGDTCLVFLTKDFAQTAKPAKELLAGGAVFRFDPLKPSALNGWVRERAARSGKTVSPDVLRLFVERVGRNLRLLSSELEKLVTYLGDGREIDEESILAVTARGLQADIFALTEAAAYGNTSKSLHLLKDLLAAGEPPLVVLNMLARQFRLIGEAMELFQEGERDLAAGLGLRPYAAEKLAAQVRQMDDSRLTRAVEMLVQADLDIKRGRIDPVLALETLVVALGKSA